MFMNIHFTALTVQLSVYTSVQGLNLETELAMTLNLTPRISQETIFNSVVSQLNKHRRGVFGPPEGFKMILFLDNLGLPLPDKHGDQP